MSNSLFRKFFFAFSAVILLVLVSVLFFVNWSFERGFNDYLLAEDQQRLGELNDRLLTHYQQHNSWQKLVESPRAWPRLVSAGQDGREFRPPPRGPKGGDRGRPPPRDAGSDKRQLRFDHRIALLGEDQQLVAGNPQLAREVSTRKPRALYRVPILWDERQIGELVLQPPAVIDNQLASAFQSRQISQMLWVAPVALLLGLLAAAVLVRHFLRPIKSLAAGTHQLAEGEYSHRLSPVGKDELAQLTVDFNQLAQALEKGQRLRQRWIADTSHELRTPLSVLRSEIEAIQDGIRQPDPQRIGALHAQVLSLSKLVDDLHQLSLGDAGLLQSHMQCLDLRDLLQDVVLANDSGAMQCSLALSLNLPETPLMVQGDTARLLQLFNNLVGNSLRHTTAGGVIEITAKLEGAQVVVDISDSAPGVSDEALPRLFERLYRPDESRNRQDGGSGLGLSIAEQIAQAHGGQLSAEHSPLGGLSLCLTLPNSPTNNRETNDA